MEEIEKIRIKLKNLHDSQNFSIFHHVVSQKVFQMRTVTRKVKSISRLNKIYETLMNNDRLWKRKAGITMSCQLNPPMVEVIDERHEITTRYIVVK